MGLVPLGSKIYYEIKEKMNDDMSAGLDPSYESAFGRIEISSDSPFNHPTH